ncbi:SPOR domain-containing protein [Portibacter lacus]|uniref:SPOR domain-containing protein n=1 Tax=Portibacter lacus TaxID=1099794 RepID=A0AA37SRN7_9BACT|nr:SPOR domain-containing protein [Portibacter lacus]GLR19007.1 hypothetical protein GCM10007940_36230 [Portibacter lacus]
MNRILKIVGYAVMLFLVYIGSTSLLKSCKGAENDGNNIEITEDGYTSDEEIYDEFFESDEEAAEAKEQAETIGSSEVDSEYNSTETDGTDYDEDFSFEVSESEKKKASVAAAKPATKTTATPTSKPAYSSNAGTGGSYLVVAGSYLIKDNAQKMVDKLKKLGYTNAEIVNFDESQYHSISAGRYDSYDSAGKVAKTLKQKGIDCYVHTRK